MAAIDFPASPSVGQAFTAGNGVTYFWNGLLWVASGASAGGDFCATHSGGAIPVSAATLVLPTVVTGNSGGWYSTSTGRFTPPAGRFQIFAQYMATQSAASHCDVYLRKNGTVIQINRSSIASSGYYANPTAVITADANGTDWFDMQIAANAGATGTNLMFGAFPISGIKGPPGDYPSGLKLYSEQVLASPAAEMRVTIPANTKKIEIVYQTANVGYVDAPVLFQAMEGSTPYTGVTYVDGLHYQAQNTPQAYASPAQPGFLYTTGRGFTGTLRPIINTVLNTVGGDGTFSGLNAATTAYTNGQCGFSYISGIANVSTITGWRLVNGTAVNFQAGSFMRCFTVV